MVTAPTTETVLRELPRPRLAEVARLHGVALPNRPREEQVAYLLDTIDLAFGPLLGRLTREELRRACRDHGLDDSTRSRTELAQTLLGAFEGDPGEHEVEGLFAASRADREAPEPNDVTRTRSPGSATSSTAARPVGEDPEYVLPMVFTTQPVSICSLRNPRVLPAWNGNFPLGM